MDEHIVPETEGVARRGQPQSDSRGGVHHRSEIYKNWLQIAAFVMAAPWAIWNFYFKEVSQPKRIPVNISLNLDMTKIASDSTDPQAATGIPNKDRLASVELTVKATNPSSRTVFLLPSVWGARGYKIQRTEAKVDFPSLAVGSITRREIEPVEKYATVSNSETIAAGRLFPDDELHPSESITRRIVFHIPQGAYDVVEVYTHVPSTSNPKEIGIDWSFHGNEFYWRMTRQGKPIRDKAVPKDTLNEEYQQSISRAAMAL